MLHIKAGSRKMDYNLCPNSLFPPLSCRIGVLIWYWVWFMSHAELQLCEVLRPLDFYSNILQQYLGKYFASVFLTSWDSESNIQFFFQNSVCMLVIWFGLKFFVFLQGFDFAWIVAVIIWGFSHPIRYIAVSFSHQAVLSLLSFSFLFLKFIWVGWIEWRW